MRWLKLSPEIINRPSDHNLAIACQHISYNLANISVYLSVFIEVNVSINIELPSPLEIELTTEASQLNLPLTDYILHVLSVRASTQNPPKTGAELLDYWKNAGVIGSRADIVDSQGYACKLRDEAGTRRQL
jgi:hypothetical protein